MSEVPEKRVLPQDLPQYEQSLRVGSTAKRKQAEADYEREVSQYDKEQRAAEEKYQRELAEFNKQNESQRLQQEIKEKYDKRVQELKEQKTRDIQAYDAANPSYDAQSRDAKKQYIAGIEQDYKKKIERMAREQQSIVLPIILREQGYPEYAITKATRAYSKGESLTIGSAIERAERTVKGKEAQAERAREISVQEAINAPSYTKEQQTRIDFGTEYLSRGGTEAMQARAQNIKQTPDVITGKQAEKTRAPLTMVKTVENIYGGQQIETNPRAFVASLTRQEVAPSGTKEEPKTIFSFQNVTDVKEESGRALLEFQSQLKTETAPAASVYRGILAEKGLKETPLAKRIIETYSAKPTKEYKTRAEAFGLEEAKGRKGIISSPLGAKLFDLETGMGDVNIGKKFGFVYDYNLGKPVKDYPKTFEGSLQYVLSPKVQGPPKPRYETVKVVPGSLEFAVKTSQTRPISSFGERVEYGLKLIESEQKKYAKYNDDAGQLLHAGLGFGKDVLAGTAYIENKLWEGESLVRGGTSKTREISIPPTAFGVATEEALSGRPQMIYPKILEYEKTYGKGSTAGEVFSLAVPLPGAKIRTPAIISENAVKIWQKTKIPQFGRFVSGKIGAVELNKNLRTTTKIAESRADEGIYGIKKEGKKTFLIERGLEEQRTKIGITKAEPQLKTKTKTMKESIITQIPKKQIIPQVGKESKTPVTVVRFGQKVRGKVTVTDFTPPRDFPTPPKRIIISSPDIEFIRQQRSLKATEISKGVFEILNPRKKTLKRIAEMEKAGYLSNVATGRTAPLRLVKKKLVKEQTKKPRTVKEMLAQSKLKIIKIKPTFSIGRGISKISKETTILGERKPATVKEMRKLEKKLLKQKREESIFDVIERPQITQVYETLGGLGKAKFVKDVTKTKDIIPFGSKDLERKLESVGLGEKRIIGQPKTPYNYSQLKPAKGIGGSVGKARTISESAKGIIIKSSIPKLEPKKIPIDYLQVRSGYIPRSTEEATSVSGTPYSTEYITPRYPEEKISRLSTKVAPILETKIKMDISQIPSVMQQGGQRTQLDTSLVTKQKEETLQKQKYKLDTSLVTKRALRTRQTPRVRLVAATIPDIMQSAAQPQQLKQPQRLQLKQKQVQIFKYKYPERIKEPEPGRRRPAVFWLKEGEIPKSVLKKRKEKADFLGASSELQISGVFKRQDITYGQKKIARLLKGDVRVVQGKPRATKQRRKEQKDLMGFSKSKKSKTRFW